MCTYCYVAGVDTFPNLLWYLYLLWDSVLLFEFLWFYSAESIVAQDTTWARWWLCISIFSASFKELFHSYFVLLVFSQHVTGKLGWQAHQVLGCLWDTYIFSMEKGFFRQVKIKILPFGMGGWWLGAAKPGAHTCLCVLTGFGKGRSCPTFLGWACFCIPTYVQDFQPKEILKLFRTLSGANCSF